jgi:hypothetical protein
MDMMEECLHDDYEINIIDGRATCDSCGYAWTATDTQMKRHEEAMSRCYECEVNYADTPSKLCPGCQAYREHQS